IQGGCAITVDPSPEVTADQLRFYLLTRAFAILLHQRGASVLHGSAVALGGRAAIFLGTWGQGKSTLAEALWRRGHALMTDDVAAVRFTAGGPEALPSYPQLRRAPPN